MKISIETPASTIKRAKNMATLCSWSFKWSGFKCWFQGTAVCMWCFHTNWTDAGLLQSINLSVFNNAYITIAPVWKDQFCTTWLYIYLKHVSASKRQVTDKVFVGNPGSVGDERSVLSTTIGWNYPFLSQRLPHKCMMKSGLNLENFTLGTRNWVRNTSMHSGDKLLRTLD